MGSQSHGITRAVIGYLAAIALGYALGRAHGHVIVKYDGPGHVKKTKKTKKTKMVREEGVTMKRGTGECDDDTVTKNTEQQVRKEKWCVLMMFSQNVQNSRFCQ